MWTINGGTKKKTGIIHREFWLKFSIQLQMSVLPNWPTDLMQYQWKSQQNTFVVLCTQVDSKIYIKGKEFKRGQHTFWKRMINLRQSQATWF